MGQGNTKVDNSTIKFLGSQVDRYFGKIKIYKAFHRQKPIVGVKIQKQVVDVLQHTNLKHPNLFEVLTYDSNFQELWFTQEGMNFYFEFCDQTLWHIVEERKSRGQRFSEKEILRLLTDLGRVLEYLWQNKISHRNLHTRSIFYDPQEKRMKIYNNELLFGENQIYLKFWRRAEDQIGYPVPEVLEEVRRSEQYRYLKDFTISPEQEQTLNNLANKSDLFALGLVILETATYKDSEGLFQKQGCRVNFSELNARLGLVRALYGVRLELVLRQILQEAPGQRPDIQLVIDWGKNQNSIVPALSCSSVSSTQKFASSSQRLSLVQPRVRSSSQSFSIKQDSTPDLKQRKQVDYKQATVTTNTRYSGVIMRSSAQRSHSIQNSPQSQKFSICVTQNSPAVRSFILGTPNVRVLPPRKPDQPQK